MGKKLHPALEWEKTQIARAAYFTATQYIGRAYDRREAATLEEARAIARTMPPEMGPVMLYAVTPEGWTAHIENYRNGEENDMNDIATSNDDGTSKAPRASKGKCKGKGTKAARPRKATPSAAPKEEKEPKALARGKIYELKKLILANPDITVDDLDAQLVAKGFGSSKAAAASFKGDLLHTLRLLAELGMLDWPRKT